MSGPVLVRQQRAEPYDLGVPIPPKRRTGGPTAKHIDDLREMPIGASIFFPVNSGTAHNYARGATEHGGGGPRRYEVRAALENRVRGFRIWKVDPASEV